MQNSGNMSFPWIWKHLQFPYFIESRNKNEISSNFPCNQWQLYFCPSPAWWGWGRWFTLINLYSVINSNCHKVKAYLACLRTFYIKTPLVKIVPEIGKFIISARAWPLVFIYVFYFSIIFDTRGAGGSTSRFLGLNPKWSM